MLKITIKNEKEVRNRLRELGARVPEAAIEIEDKARELAKDIDPAELKRLGATKDDLMIAQFTGGLTISEFEEQVSEDGEEIMDSFLSK